LLWKVARALRGKPRLGGVVAEVHDHVVNELAPHHTAQVAGRPYAEESRGAPRERAPHECPRAFARGYQGKQERNAGRSRGWHLQLPPRAAGRSAACGSPPCDEAGVAERADAGDDPLPDASRARSL